MSPQVKCFDFHAMSDADRRACIQQHRISLTPEEAITIQSLLQRPPTLAECILWGIQSSEHCSYKSTRKHLKTLCTDGPNVVSGAKEDAGIVWVCEDNQKKRYCVAISHESHNHPSQIVPFEGAATGIGGNVRDVSCMGAEVIANADSLRFGHRDSHQSQWISEAAIKGIASYGNALGVPNIAGDCYFHDGFNDNCLVTAVTLGILREDHLIHSYAPANATGYHLILVGKPTDNSGFGGASFASADLNESDIANNRAAVQEPNAFLGRVLLKANLDLFQKLQDSNHIDRVGFKDLGAGGIACASIELADSAGYGAEIFIEKVPVNKSHLDPSVILCAETQERYLWVVSPDLSETVINHYNQHWQLPKVSSGACAALIGYIRDNQQYVVRYHKDILISAKASDITKGIVYDRPVKKPNKTFQTVVAQQSDLKIAWQKVKAHSMLSSQKFIYDQYDKQVQGRTVIERGQADAGVLQPFNSNDYPVEIQTTGIALSTDANPFYGQIDPYWTAVNAVIHSVAKVTAVGAIPWALTDCLCFGNPENSEQMWELTQSIKGLKEASEGIGLIGYKDAPLPIIAGNVSLYNQNTAGKAIPASPMISCLGKLTDVKNALTPQLKSRHSVLICLGERYQQLGGSVYHNTCNILTEQLPKPKIENFKKALYQFHALHDDHYIQSAKAIGYGGVLAAVYAMTHNSAVGVCLSDNLSQENNFWFDESPGWILEIDQKNFQNVRDQLNTAGVDWIFIGETQVAPHIHLAGISL